MNSYPHKKIVRVAVEIAKLVIDLVPKNELWPRQAIKITEKWLRDDATLESVQEARDAIYAVYTGADVVVAYDAAAYAAYAAINAADAAVTDAATAAVCAANYATYAAAYASPKYSREWHLERVKILRECLKIAKKTFGVS